MIDVNAMIYPRGFTIEEKCKLWIEVGLASEQEYDLLKTLMEKYNPTTGKENKLVLVNLLYHAGEYSDEEYKQILQRIEQG